MHTLVCRRTYAMASQLTGSLEIRSYVRGYHAYKDTWNPLPGDVLQLSQDPDNTRDKCTVAIIKGGVVVGNVP